MLTSNIILWRVNPLLIRVYP